MQVLDLGRCEYQKAYEIQVNVMKKVIEANEPDTLILVEHPPVITLGRNASPDNLLSACSVMEQAGIQVVQSDRGGDVTYHGPGQLVGYPIFNIRKNHGGSIRTFVSNLEEIFIKMLIDNWGIEARRDECNSGVWVDNDKITALGLAVKRGVTLHGFAFNVSTNLNHYQYIVPCGLVGKGVTSLEKCTGQNIALDRVKPLVVKEFEKVFGA